MEKEHSIPLGDYHDTTYFLSVRIAPSYTNPKDFSFSICFKDSSSFEMKEIVRIDNSHGYTHLICFKEAPSFR